MKRVHCFLCGKNVIVWPFFGSDHLCLRNVLEDDAESGWGHPAPYRQAQTEEEAKGSDGAVIAEP
jgi:hypothetical protein